VTRKVITKNDTVCTDMRERLIGWLERILASPTRTVPVPHCCNPPYWCRWFIPSWAFAGTKIKLSIENLLISHPADLPYHITYTLPMTNSTKAQPMKIMPYIQILNSSSAIVNRVKGIRYFLFSSTHSSLHYVLRGL